MLEIISVFVTILQYLTLFFVLGAFALTTFAGIYLMSAEIRDLVHDFEMWAAHRRLKRRMKDKQYPTIFEAVAANHGPDVQNLLRTGKAQAVRDQTIINRATEYTNALNG